MSKLRFFLLYYCFHVWVDFVSFILLKEIWFHLDFLSLFISLELDKHCFFLSKFYQVFWELEFLFEIISHFLFEFFKFKQVLFLKFFKWKIGCCFIFIHVVIPSLAELIKLLLLSILNTLKFLFLCCSNVVLLTSSFFSKQFLIFKSSFLCLCITSFIFTFDSIFFKNSKKWEYFVISCHLSNSRLWFSVRSSLLWNQFFFQSLLLLIKLFDHFYEFFKLHIISSLSI